MTSTVVASGTFELASTSPSVSMLKKKRTKTMTVGMIVQMISTVLLPWSCSGRTSSPGWRRYRTTA